MNNKYKTLDQLLAALRIPILELKKRTGITVPRLRGIYKYCDPTQEEVKSLFAALKPTLADFIANGGQTGHFNQAGTNHTQNVTINVLVQITPLAPKALGESPQRNTNRLLPGGQADAFSSGMATGSRGF